MQARTVDVAGTPVRWLESGEGIPVVFVHGIPTSPALWRHVLPRVTDARCLAFEMVGYGESIPAGEGRDISLAAQARYLLGWLDQLGIERAVLVGHDLGGGVAQIAAARRPEACAGLLLTNAVGYDSWPIPSVKALRAAPGVVSRTPGVAMAAALAPLILRGHDNLFMARESLPIHAAPYARYGGGAGLARQLRSLDVADTLAVQDQLPALEVPARVVWGVADRFQKLRYGQRFAADLHTTVRRIDGRQALHPGGPSRGHRRGDRLPARRGFRAVTGHLEHPLAVVPMVEEADAVGRVAAVRTQHRQVARRLPAVPCAGLGAGSAHARRARLSRCGATARRRSTHRGGSRRLAGGTRGPSPVHRPLARMLLLACGLHAALDGTVTGPAATA